LTGGSFVLAQQKPQWMPGQVGLNAGILPSPGFTYVNIDENYDAGNAIGGQLNYILPAKNFSLFFKGYHEYSASSHTLGTTFCFGGAWTLLIPKPPPPKS
jgi:hypothetical protein